MKEFRKPKSYIPNLSKWIGDMKTMLPNSILSTIPEEYHNKVGEDFIYLGMLYKNLPEEGDNTSVALSIFKHSIIGCYFTLLKITNYELNVVHYIEEFDKSFAEQCETGLPLITFTLERFGKSLNQTDIENLQDVMSLEFMENYARTFYPAIFETLNN